MTPLVYQPNACVHGYDTFALLRCARLGWKVVCNDKHTSLPLSDIKYLQKGLLNRPYYDFQ